MSSPPRVRASPVKLVGGRGAEAEGSSGRGMFLEGMSKWRRIYSRGGNVLSGSFENLFLQIVGVLDRKTRLLSTGEEVLTWVIVTVIAIVTVTMSFMAGAARSA